MNLSRLLEMNVPRKREGRYSLPMPEGKRRVRQRRQKPNSALGGHHVSCFLRLVVMD